MFQAKQSVDQEQAVMILRSLQMLNNLPVSQRIMFGSR